MILPPQARVLRVGTVVKNPGGGMYVEGWEFDLYGVVNMWDMGEDNELRYCGYSYDELREITKRPSEFLEEP